MLLLIAQQVRRDHLERHGHAAAEVVSSSRTMLAMLSRNMRMTPLVLVRGTPPGRARAPRALPAPDVPGQAVGAPPIARPG